MNDLYQRIAPDVKLGRDVKIYAFVNLYGCEIGDETRIGTLVHYRQCPPRQLDGAGVSLRA